MRLYNPNSFWPISRKRASGWQCQASHQPIEEAEFVSSSHLSFLRQVLPQTDGDGHRAAGFYPDGDRRDAGRKSGSNSKNRDGRGRFSKATPSPLNILRCRRSRGDSSRLQFDPARVFQCSGGGASTGQQGCDRNLQPNRPGTNPEGNGVTLAEWDLLGRKTFECFFE